MTQRIQLDDLIGDVGEYEPTLLRIPLNREETFSDEELTHAAAKTAQDILKRNGVTNIEISDEDAATAQEQFMKHINNAPIEKAQIMKPATVLKLEAILSEYDQRVINHADQIRYLVTNKLVELSDHRDPKVQLKAVELLGKIADVGMFVEKQEITYKQISDDELQKRLAAKLGLLIEGEVVDDKVVTPEQAFAENKLDVLPLPQTAKITPATVDMILNSK